MASLFSNKLVQAAFAAASTLLNPVAAVTEMVAGDNPSEILNGKDYNIVSFYRSSNEDSREIDMLMDGAEHIFEKKVESKEWKPRTVGWFRVDLDKAPELGLAPDMEPDQIMFAPGMRRAIHFEKAHEQKSANEQLLATIVKELSGDWIRQVQCEGIQDKERWFYDEVVYFGPSEDLEEGGEVSDLIKAALFDRYNFDEQRVGFWYNEDPECRKARQLDEDKRYIVFFHGENSVPFILEVGEDSIDLPRLMHEISVGIVKGTPKWGQRAQDAMFTHFANGLIYMMPEQIEPIAMMKDWRVMLMVRMIEIMQETDTSFIPVVTPHIQEPADQMIVSQLSEMMEVSKDDLPNFFVLHPLTEQVVPYPEALDDVQNFSPESILLWARRTVLYLELEYFEQQVDIFEAKQKKDDGKLTEEEEKRMEQLKLAHTGAGEELKVVIENLEIVEKKLANKENTFADALDIHKNVSHDHMHRIENAATAVKNDEL